MKAQLYITLTIFTHQIYNVPSLNFWSRNTHGGYPSAPSSATINGSHHLPSTTYCTLFWSLLFLVCHTQNCTFLSCQRSLYSKCQISSSRSTIQFSLFSDGCFIYNAWLFWDVYNLHFCLSWNKNSVARRTFACNRIELRWVKMNNLTFIHSTHGRSSNREADLQRTYTSIFLCDKEEHIWVTYRFDTICNREPTRDAQRQSSLAYTSFSKQKSELHISWLIRLGQHTQSLLWHVSCIGGNINIDMAVESLILADQLVRILQAAARQRILCMQTVRLTVSMPLEPAPRLACV